MTNVRAHVVRSPKVDRIDEVLVTICFKSLSCIVNACPLGEQNGVLKASVFVQSQCGMRRLRAYLTLAHAYVLADKDPDLGALVRKKSKVCLLLLRLLFSFNLFVHSRVNLFLSRGLCFQLSSFCLGHVLCLFLVHN